MRMPTERRLDCTDAGTGGDNGDDGAAEISYGEVEVEELAGEK
jgi:hypothetical protein